MGSIGYDASLMRPQLHRIAYRVAENRVVAGVHYPIDSLAGQALGITLARVFAELAGAGNLGIPKEVEFPAGSWKTDAEPTLDAPWPFEQQALAHAKAPEDAAPDLRSLWEQAKEECRL